MELWFRYPEEHTGGVTGGFSVGGSTPNWGARVPKLCCAPHRPAHPTPLTLNESSLPQLPPSIKGWRGGALGVLCSPPQELQLTLSMTRLGKGRHPPFAVCCCCCRPCCWCCCCCTSTSGCPGPCVHTAYMPHAACAVTSSCARAYAHAGVTSQPISGKRP